MKLYQRVVIGDGERGTEYRNRQIARILMPGVHQACGQSARRTIEVAVSAISRRPTTTPARTPMH